jgi:hypothetical protein
MSHYECGSSRANTRLAIVIALDSVILFLMLTIFFEPAVAQKCDGSGIACIYEIQSLLINVRIMSLLNKDGVPWCEPSYMVKLFVLM